MELAWKPRNIVDNFANSNHVSQADFAIESLLAELNLPALEKQNNNNKCYRVSNWLSKMETQRMLCCMNETGKLRQISVIVKQFCGAKHCPLLHRRMHFCVHNNCLLGTQLCDYSIEEWWMRRGLEDDKKEVRIPASCKPFHISHHHPAIHEPCRKRNKWWWEKQCPRSTGHLVHLIRQRLSSSLSLEAYWELNIVLGWSERASPMCTQQQQQQPTTKITMAKASSIQRTTTRLDGLPFIKQC